MLLLSFAIGLFNSLVATRPGLFNFSVRLYLAKPGISFIKCKQWTFIDVRHWRTEEISLPYVRMHRGGEG
jgi:hypothetical protein